MTKQEDYPANVAKLIEQAFQNLGNGLARLPGDGREDFLAEAQLQIHAAQAIATLNAARETRIQTLLQLATQAPADGAALNPDLVREAYEAALSMLGLIEVPEGMMTEAELQAALGIDPAAEAKLDEDLGDLG